MKKRTISAIVMLLIVIPLLLKGEIYFQLGVIFLSGCGLYELFQAKEKDKKIPMVMQILSYIFLFFFLFSYHKEDALNFVLDWRFLIGFFLFCFLPVVLYHDEKTYGILDAIFLFFSIFLLAIGFLGFLLVRNLDFVHFLYLVLLAIMTDTFAYFTGMLIGKHKLCEVLSPKKTIEGSVGGIMMGTVIATAFYWIVVSPDAEFFLVLLVTFLLSVVSQVGDLFFSSIKRHYNIKDFSKLIPGHGGILDRLDSMIFVVITYILFVSIL